MNVTRAMVRFRG